MTSYYLQLKQYIVSLMGFFMDAQINLPAKARRGNLLALLCNFNIWYSITLTCFFFYLVAQCNPPDVKVAQNWGAFISLQVATKGINSVIRSEEILSLFAWYQQTYETHSKETYQKIFVKYQERQNFYIKMIIQFLPRLLYVVAILYLLTPFLMGAGGLPTPLFWKGIPDTEISRWIYWTYFLAMVYVCYTVVTSIIAIDSFFAVSVIILAHRFKAIGDILNLLNYDGARDLKEDQEIIRDCYDMHLDLLNKIKVFQKYFNIYGLFHFISPIVVQVSVWYYITLSGINAMCIMLMVLMFLNVSMVCFFGQVLKELGSQFSSTIVLSHWHELCLRDQKSILLILLRSQASVSIKTGDMYELDFTMLTQVVKFQASLYAVLKTFFTNN